MDEYNAKPLHILVVGAGIGGLSAAIALRQQGHVVESFEQSRFANELGAAIHLAPNANGLLKRIGVDAESFGANPTQWITQFKGNGEFEFSRHVEKQAGMWQHRWLLAHRVHLHEALKSAATNETGKGIPVRLRTSSKVIDVDTENATITLENGEVYSGDLVIGADGVHSRTRAKLTDKKPFSSGKNAFRFLISKQAALDDPQTAPLLQKSGELIMWIGNDRRVVLYPTNFNGLINFVCIHPSSESDAKLGGDWNHGGNKDTMLKVFDSFDPICKALLNKACPETLRLWQLLDCEPIEKWAHGRFALMGDAAHPFLPHQGQGGAVAIEDGISFAAILPLGTKPEDIPDRLRLYEQCRIERANRIQEYTRQAGEDLNKKELNMMEYTAYNFGHDEWDHSTQALREYLAARNPDIYRRMPISFGAYPGPRQDFYGRPRDGTDSTALTASIRFKTSRTLLQNLFPSKAFSFQSPGTICEASLSVTTLDKMQWLAGGGYSHFGLYLHGVQYRKADGSLVKGTFLPVLFENLADPVLSGREELGFPKLVCDLDIQNDDQHAYSLQAGWRGKKFASLKLEDLHDIAPPPGLTNGTKEGEGNPQPSPPPTVDDGLFLYRYIPSVGHRGKAEAEYAVFVDNAAEQKVTPTVIEETTYVQDASFSFDALSWNELPTLHHIVARLAEIPNYGVVSAKITRGRGVQDVSTGRRIE